MDPFGAANVRKVNIRQCQLRQFCRLKLCHIVKLCHSFFQVKSDGKISLEIKDIGGGKLGKSEGSPLLQSEAPQPILCCTIL